MHKVSKSDLRIFGFIWSLIFAFLAHKFVNFSTIFSALSLATFLLSAFCPKIFLQSKIYQTWIKFGDFLGKINGFLISFILFYGVFTPIGIATKLMKKDLLNKKLDKAASSYFIDRKSQPHEMKNQF